MSHNVYVGNYIKFTGAAKFNDNVKGNLSTERMCSVDWFDQTALDTTNDYTATLGGTNDAAALTAGGYCGLTLTTGTGDDEVSFLATALIFDISQEPEIEAKIKIVDVSGTFVFFGFSDATSETSPAATIDYAGGTLAAAATDAAGFVCDADKGSSSLYVASIASGGSVTGADTGIDWEDNQSKVLRVKLDSSGNAYYYVDGVQYGYKASAVTDVPLCAIFNFGTRADDGSNVVYVRYLKKWQDIA